MLRAVRDDVRRHVRSRCEWAKMADSVAAGLGDEKETENEDKEREKLAFRATTKADMNSSASELTETLGFYEKKAKKRDKRSVSGKSPTVKC